MSRGNRCSSCRYAGNTSTASHCAPGITKAHLEEMYRKGGDYYCTKYQRSVRTEEGETCSGWVSDVRD